MKYAIIGDIHGNAPALRLVLDDARAHHVDGCLLAGDYCISAPWANEVISLLRQLPNALVIRGNDENHLDLPDSDDGQFEASRWCARSLSADNKAWLDALPEEISFTCSGVPIRMVHDAQRILGKVLYRHFRTSVLPSRFPHGPLAHEDLLTDFRSLMTQDETCANAVSALDVGVYIFAHNHIQAHGCFHGKWLVNPGSCGLPLDCGDFAACYTILTIENGSVQVEERRIPYDAEALIAQAKATGQYTHARIWSEIIFSEWRTCREKVFFFLTHTEEYASRIGDPRRPFAKDTWQAAYQEWLTAGPMRWPELFVR